jgi:ribosomal protein S5
MVRTRLNWIRGLIINVHHPWEAEASVLLAELEYCSRQSSVLLVPLSEGLGFVSNDLIRSVFVLIGVEIRRGLFQGHGSL